MKDTIRCCISCILPCGALDVVRIVHSNGYVEEISGSIKASEILRAYPKHVLKKPSSPPSDEMGNISTVSGVVPTRIVVVPPDAELQRGKIYFLMPVSVDSGKNGRPSRNDKKRRGSGTRQDHHRPNQYPRNYTDNRGKNSDDGNNLLISDQYLSEILSEKVSTQRERRRGRVGVWMPRLESICETQNDD